jgi:SOS-response transcriptional repressor LexA
MFADVHESLHAALVPYCQGQSGRSLSRPLLRYIRRTMEDTMFDRITQRLEALGMTERHASMLAVGNADLVRNLKRNRSRSPRGDSLGKLAKVLRVSEAWLLGNSSDDAEPAVERPFGVRFGGVVEAGTFRPQNDLSQDDDYRLVPLPHDARYPATAQYAFSVMGDSMTRERIFEGMHVLGVDLLVWERLHGAPRDGQLVVVARTRNGHPERELTVKKLRIFTDRLELQPCSDNPGYSPLVFPLPLQEDAMADACIIAVVLSATWIYL